MRKLSLMLGCLVLPLSTLAHHGAGGFDQKTLIEMQGTVTEYRWGNPHVYMAIETTDSTGKRYVQQVEAAPAAQLLPRGVTRDLVRAGDRLTLRVNPSYSGVGPGHTVLGFELRKADGSRYPLTTRALQALGTGDSVATNLVGTWVPQPEGFFALGAAVAKWPKTDLAREVMASPNRPEVTANRLKCIPQGAPFMMANSVPIIVAVGRDAVTIDIDWGDTRRIAHLGATHPAGIRPTLHGHSIGQWEGAVLVVDTVGFAPHPEGLGFGFPSSTAKHIIERFALSDDRKHLDYEITVEDPVYLTAPVRYRTQWDYRPGLKLSPSSCDPVSARRYLDDKQADWRP